MKKEVKLLALLLIALLSYSSIATALEIEQSTKVTFCNVDAKAVLNMANSFTLKTNDENNNGHTILRHVAKDKAALVERLRNDASLEIVSSYPDINKANEAIRAGIKLDAERIAKWLSSPDTIYSLVLYFQAKDSLGYGISRKNINVTFPLSNFVVILRKHSGCTFRVLTSYPSEPEEYHVK